jgi:hypothetical protein
MTPDASRAATPMGNMEVRSFSPVTEPRKLDPALDRQSSRLLRCGPQGAHATHRGPHLIHRARIHSSHAKDKELNSDTWGLHRYWLPDLLKHEYVTLRFLAQESYEQAASILC